MQKWLDHNKENLPRYHDFANQKKNFTVLNKKKTKIKTFRLEIYLKNHDLRSIDPFLEPLLMPCAWNGYLLGRLAAGREVGTGDTPRLPYIGEGHSLRVGYITTLHSTLFIHMIWGDHCICETHLDIRDPNIFEL